MARIYQRNDRPGHWYLDVKSPSGKRVRKKLGRSRRLAEQALADYELKLQRRELGFDAREIHLEAFWERCIAHSRAVNSESQVARVSCILEHFQRFLAETFPAISRLSQLTPQVFQEYQQHRLASSSRRCSVHLKRKTINIETKALKTMMNRAIEWGFLRETPCRVKSLKETDSIIVRALTGHEVGLLLDNAKDHWLYPVIFTMLYSGLRLGECRWLTWDDIEFDRSIIRIRRKQGWIPKSSGGEVRERDVYIGEQLVAFLQRHRLTCQYDDQWVFHGARTDRLSRFSSLAFAGITKQLGFPDVTRLHSLRHTYITHLLRSGVDIATVQEQAGHKSILTTRRYIDVFEDQKKKAAEALNYSSSDHVEIPDKLSAVSS